MPMRWIRTKASSAAGAAGSGRSRVRNCCGASREMAFMTERTLRRPLFLILIVRTVLVVFRQAFLMPDIMHRSQNLQDFVEQFAIDRQLGPFRPFANVVGISTPRDGGRNVFVQQTELQG